MYLVFIIDECRISMCVYIVDLLCHMLVGLLQQSNFPVVGLVKVNLI